MLVRLLFVVEMWCILVWLDVVVAMLCMSLMGEWNGPGVAARLERPKSVMRHQWEGAYVYQMWIYPDMALQSTSWRASVTTTCCGETRRMYVSASAMTSIHTIDVQNSWQSGVVMLMTLIPQSLSDRTTNGQYHNLSNTIVKEISWAVVPYNTRQMMICSMSEKSVMNSDIIVTEIDRQIAKTSEIDVLSRSNCYERKKNAFSFTECDTQV